MKKFHQFLFILVSIIFVSCNTEITAENIEANSYIISTLDDYNAKTDQLPLQEAIDLYIQAKTDLGPLNHSDQQIFYTVSFSSLMEKGLKNHEDKNLKMMILNDQMNSKNNSPMITEFFSLLHSCRKDLSSEEIQKIQSAFVTKNLTLIDNINWSNEENRKLKYDELLLASNNFSKSIGYLE